MQESSEVSPGSRSNWSKWLVLGLVASAVVVGYRLFGDELTLTKLATREAEFRDLQQRQPLLVYGTAFLVYVAVTGLSLPGATALTLICGWLFGVWRGVLLVSFASTTGATLAFLISRFLLRDSIQKKFGDRLTTFNQALEREGAFYLFMLRLIPAVPFFVINVVMGLTPLPTRTYWWVSEVGMLPGTAVYVYAGSSVPNLKTLAEQGPGGILSPQLLLAFVLLGTVPLIIKRIVGRLRPTTTNSPDESESP